LIIVVIVIVDLLLALFFASRRRAAQRSEEQRERTRGAFGSEYERMAQERGSEEEAERELRERRVERRVEPLSEESRAHYKEQWGEVERIFVDNPERSIEMADRTASDILNERNFVSDAGQSDEGTERGLAAMHPEVAGDYREAWRIRADVVARSAGRAEDSNEESTEELRQAIRKYRAVYQRLVQE
jgi:hypothetical protein